MVTIRQKCLHQNWGIGQQERCIPLRCLCTILTHYILLAGTGNIRFPVWQACCHDVPSNIFGHHFLDLLRKVLVPWNTEQDTETKSFLCRGFLQKFEDWEKGKTVLRASWSTKKGNTWETKSNRATETNPPVQLSEVWDTQKLWTWPCSPATGKSAKGLGLWKTGHHCSHLPVSAEKLALIMYDVGAVTEKWCAQYWATEQQKSRLHDVTSLSSILTLGLCIVPYWLLHV